jgi:hypothetical protein
MVKILNQLYFFLLLISLIMLWSCKEDPSSPNDQSPSISEKVNSLLSQMSVDEKIGQMTQA